MSEAKHSEQEPLKLTPVDEIYRRSSTGRVAVIATLVKYVLPLVILAIGSYLLRDFRYLLAGAFELLAIFILANSLAKRNRVLATVIGGIAMLVFNVQAVVLVFASGYVSPIMLSNIFNLEDLAGKALLYGAGAVVAVVLSFLPVAHLDRFEIKHTVAAIAVAVACEVVALLGIGSDYAPVASTAILLDQWMQYQQMMDKVRGDGTGTSPELTPYFQMEVPGGVSKPAALSGQPNVVVIFTEGLSQQIVDDKRNIMPNVAAYQQRSLNFAGYYNHTAATFRALNGQLYSGYQLNDLDANALISIQDILGDQGYHTALVNTEPFYAEWTNYLEMMGFDELVNESSTGTYSIESVTNNKMSDGEAYQTLQATMERCAESDQPFFVAMYTFGTHASLDSPEEKFKDGSSPMLNKFYNCDYQFGQFMQWFEQSEFFDNTIVVFTADHATYNELDFTTAFPKYERAHYFCDTIPYFYFFKGVEASEVDANGRTTLDFAPTLLDFLDVSAPNCFLGRSLFLDDDPNDLDSTYSDTNLITTSTDGEILYPEGEELEDLRNRINDYLTYSRIPLD